MELKGSVVLVTGANGGLGRQFVRQALERGATKVYATARRPATDWDDDRVVPLALDVTDRDSVAAAVARATDVTVVVNNAGIANGARLAGPDLGAVRELFEVNFFGALEVANAFAPVLRRNGGGALVNVLSVLSWLARGDAYSATKAALWSATNTARLTLAPTQVLALHLGYTDTPMTAALTVPKNDPADVVARAYDGVEAGAIEVLADEVSRQVKAALAGPVEALYPELAAAAPAHDQ